MTDEIGYAGEAARPGASSGQVAGWRSRLVYGVALVAVLALDIALVAGDRAGARTVAVAGLAGAVVLLVAASVARSAGHGRPTPRRALLLAALVVAAVPLALAALS